MKREINVLFPTPVAPLTAIKMSPGLEMPFWLLMAVRAGHLGYTYRSSDECSLGTERGPFWQMLGGMKGLLEGWARRSWF